MEKKLDIAKLRNRYLVINVTARDVARAREAVGKEPHTSSCPVALAAKRALRARFRRYSGIGAGVAPGHAFFYVGAKDNVGRFRLTRALQRVVAAFDYDRKVRPTRATVLLQPVDLNPDPNY